MRIIGLMGTKGSGKSTGSDYLVTQYKYKELTFAGPLKQACQALFLFNDEQLYGTQEQKEAQDPLWFGCSPRTAMQFVGTDLLRDNLDKIMPGLGKDIFTHNLRLRCEAERRSNPTAHIVISDVRFHNEANCIKEIGGIIIKVVRHDPGDMHTSETEQNNIPYDYIIYNTGTIDEYHRDLDNMLSSFDIPNYTNE